MRDLILKLMLSASFFCFTLQVAKASCDLDQLKSIEQMSLKVPDYVEQKFSTGEYECGIKAVEKAAKLSLTMTLEKGIDSRFDLRNLVLKLNKNELFPIDYRFSLVKAAATLTLTKPATNFPISEFRYDALLFSKADNQYKEQHDTQKWLKALILAISLDQNSPDSDRAIAGWMEFSLPTPAYPYLDQLLKLAELTKHDKQMLEFRSQLVSSAILDFPVWHEGISEQELLIQADQTLKLIDALDNVKGCYGCSPEWRWKLYMSVGTAYYRFGMIAEGKKYISQAIQIVHSIPNPDNRLFYLTSVISSLNYIRPERELVLPLIQEMKDLANSLQTPMAKQVK